jgi:hypothetical protein
MNADHIATRDIGSEHRIKAHIDELGDIESQHFANAVGNASPLRASAYRIGHRQDVDEVS